MELAYLPDSIPRYSLWPVYPTWEENTITHAVSKKQKCLSIRETKTDEKNCTICQQKKKRFLSDYIKHKQTTSTKIQEEDEEEEIEEQTKGSSSRKREAK